MLVTRRLGDENTPDVITNKIKRKVRELAEMCDVELPQSEQPAESQPAVQQEEPVAQAAEVKPEPQNHLPNEDYDADETWQHDNGEEFSEVFSLEYEEPNHEVPVADREPDDDITVEFIEAEDEPEPSQEPIAEPEAEPEPEPEPAPEPVKATPQPPVFRPPLEVNEEPVPEPDPNVLPEAEDEPDITVEFIEADDEPLPEPEEEMPVPPVPTEFPEIDEEPLRVDQKLQRSLSKDIRKAFSVNDRFRFQRELFAGSAGAMNTAIEHIEMMNSYGNAELYFFSQLHWDRENEVVKDFMTIVRNHFQK